MKFYELPDRYRLWMNKVEDNEGEISQELQKELEELDDVLATKGDALCAIARQFDYEEKAFREESRIFQIKAQVSANKQERIRKILLETMRAMDVDTLRGRRFLVRRGKSTAPSIRWESNHQIPERFRKVVESLDYDVALEAYKSGEELPEGMKATFKEYVQIR